ncbi:MAG: glycosyltransferase family 4 protein [Halothiobacillaceae bacterium]
MIIDITRLVDRTLQGRLPTGVDRVGMAYIERYGAQSDALVRFGWRWVFIYGHDAQALFSALLKPEASFKSLARWLVGKAYCLSWRIPAKDTVLLNTGHSGLDQPEYAKQIKKYQLRAVYFLHDLIPITYPEYCRAGESLRHTKRLETMLDCGAAIIVNSQDTARECLNFAVQTQRTCPPLAVGLLGGAALTPPSPNPPINAAYFVMLGTIEPRKNHLLILQLWRELAREFGAKAPKLVIIGQRGWECEQVVDMLERCPSIQASVIELPHCSDAELATWLHHARALLFPAFVEGYGLPLIEALNQGCPVIASDLAVFRELAFDIPDYLNPLDGAAWRHAIIQYATEQSPHRAAQLERMACFAAPTWAQHFDVVDPLLKSLTHG